MQNHNSFKFIVLLLFTYSHSPPGVSDHLTRKNCPPSFPNIAQIKHEEGIPCNGNVFVVPCGQVKDWVTFSNVLNPFVAHYIGNPTNRQVIKLRVNKHNVRWHFPSTTAAHQRKDGDPQRTWATRKQTWWWLSCWHVKKRKILSRKNLKVLWSQRGRCSFAGVFFARDYLFFCADDVGEVSCCVRQGRTFSWQCAFIVYDILFSSIEWAYRKEEQTVAVSGGHWPLWLALLLRALPLHIYRNNNNTPSEEESGLLLIHYQMDN